MEDLAGLIWQQQLGDALDEVSEAYRYARWLVFDRRPPGAVADDERLTPEQQSALDRLRVAEEMVRQLRRTRPGALVGHLVDLQPDLQPGSVLAFAR